MLANLARYSLKLHSTKTTGLRNASADVCVDRYACAYVQVYGGRVLNVGSLVCRLKKAIMQMIHGRPEEVIRL